VYRLTLRDVETLKARNRTGDMVPLGSVATFRDITGPFRVPRCNLYPAAEVQLNLDRGYSSGQGIATIEEIVRKQLLSGFSFEWTEITLQEMLADATASGPMNPA
jgi:HAE1 family hydrophobic/amphiphilic exporter-1